MHVQEQSYKHKMYANFLKLSVFANGMQSLTKYLYLTLWIFFIVFVSIFTFIRWISNRIMDITARIIIISSKLCNAEKIMQIFFLHYNKYDLTYCLTLKTYQKNSKRIPTKSRILDMRISSFWKAINNVSALLCDKFHFCHILFEKWILNQLYNDPPFHKLYKRKIEHFHYYYIIIFIFLNIVFLFLLIRSFHIYVHTDKKIVVCHAPQLCAKRLNYHFWKQLWTDSGIKFLI
jgi:hypothetical protein